MREEIAKELKKMARQTIVSSRQAKVLSVEGAECVVEDVRDSQIRIEGVNLRAVIDDSDKGVLIIPKLGSLVMIAPIENTEGDYYVSMVSEVEEVLFDIEGKYQFKNKEESLKELIDELINAVLQLTVTTGMGPSGTPINASVFEQIKGKFDKLLK